MKHFATVVQPGVVLYEVNDLPSGVLGLAFQSSSGETSMILMNMVSNVQSVDLSGVGTFQSGLQTTGDVDWESVEVPSSITLPGFSITSAFPV